MRFLVLSLIAFSWFCTSKAQSAYNFNGVWQGKIYYPDNTSSSGSIVFLQLQVSNETVSGKGHHEVYGTETTCNRKISGTFKEKVFKINEAAIEKRSGPTSHRWCTRKYELTFNDSTGYLQGTFTSSDCRGETGKIILFKSSVPWEEKTGVFINHSWLDRFNLDLKKNYNAPEIREIERKNFAFEPVYFDYDKDQIRPEYQDFLVRLVRVVDGHSDLRIRVTGHTDADGSDAYNIDLSKRRAQALIDFFVSKGLKANRIEIDFKGESLPVDNNHTPQGKQRNRRVDFTFI
jgi:OOP family OmpA-OmpF porin